MAIKSSGTISLGTTAGTDGSISGELGGTQPHALSEYYRDGSYSDGIFIPASQTSVPVGDWNGFYYTQSISFSDFYGVEAVTLTGSEAIGSWPVVFGSITHPGNQWGSKQFTNSSFAEVTATIDFLVVEASGANGTVQIRYFTSDSSAASSYTTTALTYVDLDISQSAVWQVKADWNYTTSTGAGSNAATITEPASNLDNAYRTLSTGSRVSYTWKVTANANNETGTIGGLGQGVTFYLKNTDGGGTVREVNSGSKTIFLKATRGLQQQVGGGE